MRRNCFYKRIKVNRFSGSGYIPRFRLKFSRKELNGALHNDLVLFRVPEFTALNLKKKKRFQGLATRPKILKVVERFKTEFVVEVLELKEKSIVVFFDDPLIPNKREVYGEFKELEIGEKIVLKLQSFPPRIIQGYLVKKLGKKDEKGIDYLSLVYDLNLPQEFKGEGVKAEIENLREKREKILNNLDLYEFLEDKAFVTIDGKDAKDFDDAICAEKTQQGYKVYIAVADVWAYLQHCPNIFTEATKRGTSIYLLDRVISMLPPILSEELCSLRENERKNTLCVSVELDDDMNLINKTARIFPAFIRSRKRFTYEELNEYLKTNQERKLFPDRETKDSLILSYEIVKKLAERGIAEGREPLSIHQDKYEYLLNQEGEIRELKLNDCSLELTFQKVIERFMILANKVVAKWFSEHKKKSIYRIHKIPELVKLQNFFRDISPLSSINPPLFSSQDEVTTKALNQFLEKLSNHANFNLIQHNLLLALPRAEYSINNIGHFGLNAPNYLHFTSPIRRIADLLVHKSLWMELLNSQFYSTHDKNEHQKDLDRLTYLANLNEQKGVAAERRYLSQKLYKYLLLKAHHRYFEAVITLKAEWGWMIRIKNFYDGFIKLENSKGLKNLGEKIKVRKVDYSWDEFAEI